MAGVWQYAKRFAYRRILHADDTPHRIALGVALATFVAFTPTMGLQTVIALSVAAVLRANKAVCIPFVWITNPLTFAPIYGTCWWLGARIMPGNPGIEFNAILQRMNSSSADGIFARMLSYDFWAEMVNLMLNFGWELWLGCIIVGVIFGVILYFATLWFIVAYRTRRHNRIMQRHERRRIRLQRRKLVTAGKTV